MVLESGGFYVQIPGPANKMTLQVHLTWALHYYMAWSIDTVFGSAATGAGDSPTPRKESLVITLCVWTKVVCSSLFLFMMQTSDA